MNRVVVEVRVWNIPVNEVARDELCGITKLLTTLAEV